jgi:hypothetical protein
MLAAARPCLAELHVCRCSAITDGGLDALCAASTSLSALSLAMTTISDAGLASVAMHCPHVRDLNVRKCVKLTAEATLVAVAQNGMLRRVDVSLCKAVSGVLLLEIAAHCSATLEELDVSFCRQVPAAALGHLLDECSMLQELRVFGCSQLTRAAVHGHCNERVRVIGAPTFEADKKLGGTRMSSGALDSGTEQGVGAGGRQVDGTEQDCKVVQEDQCALSEEESSDGMEVV